MKNNSFFGAILLATITLDSSVAFADNALPPILISKARTESVSLPVATNIEVISRKEIEESAAITVFDILRGHSGIQISDSSGQGKATIDMRGFGETASHNILIMIDGRRLNNSTDLAVLDLNIIDPDNIERIEIIEGSAGVLFGNQAVGGVINIITRKPEQFEGQVSIGAGSSGGEEISSRISGPLTGNISYRVYGRKHKSNGFRVNGNTDLDHASLYLNINHSRGNIFAEVEQTLEKNLLPGGLKEDEVVADRTQSTNIGDKSNTISDNFRIGGKQRLNSQWHAEYDVTYRDSESDASFGDFDLLTQRIARSVSPRLIGNVPLLGRDANVTLGYDLDLADYKLSHAYGFTDLEQKIQSLYVQTIVPISDHLTGTFGISRSTVDNDLNAGGDQADIDDDLTTGSLGLVFRPDAQWKLFARIDQNYRFATADEHAFTETAELTGLRTQTGESRELGIEHRRDHTRIKLAIYRLTLNDEIVFVPKPPPDFGVNTNLDKTTRKGVTLDVDWSPTSGVDIALSYSHIDGVFSGNQIPLVATNTGRMAATVRITDTTSLFFEEIIVGSRPLGGDYDNEAEKLSRYEIGNVALNYEYNQLKVSARLNNFLGKKYNSSAFFSPSGSDFYPAPERNYWLTATLGFGD
ncbi:MAG TPA: TonB-dependent receptor [Flavobacteriales bacterium]|jgi:iron complex outermembrane receptor protein|nr:TonB-dependent receptor [Chromatiaceae bacterium]HHZ97011.1 TonB-dependent receptor [Flavobacteriales bacterium]